MVGPDWSKLGNPKKRREPTEKPLSEWDKLGGVIAFYENENSCFVEAEKTFRKLTGLVRYCVSYAEKPLLKADRD